MSSLCILSIGQTDMRTAKCEDSTMALSHRAATPSLNKKEFAAMKMDVQRRANSTMIRSLTLSVRRRVDCVPGTQISDLTPRDIAQHDCFRKEVSWSSRLMKRAPTISPRAIDTFSADNGLHSLVVSPIGAIRNQHLSPPTKGSTVDSLITHTLWWTAQGMGF